MADNVELNAGTGGAILAAATLSFSGDTAVVQCISSGILSGSEGSWTYTQLVGGAGAVGAGVQRVTLASDDPAVASLGVMDDWDDGSDRCRVVGAAAEDAAAAGNPVLVGGRYDATARALEDADAGALALTPEGHAFVSTQPCNYAYDGNTRCLIKRFMVVTSTDGADLVAAVVGKKFRILSFAIFTTSTTVTNFWLEDSDGTDVFGDSTGIPLDADGGSGPAGLVLPFNQSGWWQTAAANKDLHIKLTAAQKVVVTGTYIEVD